MTENPLTICILYDAWHELEQEEPEPPPEGPKPSRKRREKSDREEIADALVKRGHTVIEHCLDGRRRSLKALAGIEADLVFNLTESYGGDDTKDLNIAAYLDLLHLPYTGSGPSGLLLAQDKAVAKRLFTFHGLRTPDFATVYQGRLQWSDDIHFPVIVKPKREDGSIGIEFSAVVGSIKELMERIDALHADLDSPVLIEEYIEGRELYVGVLGTDKPESLPIVELDLSSLPEGTPKIAGTEVKWEEDTQAYKATKPFFPDDLDEEVTKKLQDTAVQAFQALQLRDYGRVDFRLATDGTVHVLEVNPNPYLMPTAEFSMAAKKSGRSFVETIGEIVNLAVARYSTQA